MRGKLQNFAKAAILTTVQENCSIDDLGTGSQPSYGFLTGAIVKLMAL